MPDFGRLFVVSVNNYITSLNNEVLFSLYTASVIFFVRQTKSLDIIVLFIYM